MCMLVSEESPKVMSLKGTGESYTIPKYRPFDVSMFFFEYVLHADDEQAAVIGVEGGK